MKELVARICREMSSLHGKSPNYIVVQSLINTFVKNNPDADPLEVDWAAIYDPRLTYEEMLEELKRSYPQYKWSDPGHVEEKEFEDSVINHILTQVEDLSEDSLRSLLNALEERLEALRAEETPTEHDTESASIQPQPQQQPQSQTTATQQPVQPPKVTLRLLASYPFLTEAREVVKGVSFEGLPEAVYQRARGRIVEALERGELGVIPRLDNPWTELLSFPVAKAVVHTIDDDWLKRRWALAESARVERLLRQESDEVFDLLSRLLNVRREGMEYAVHFVDYLKLAEGLTTDISWKLVNQRLQRGWVFLTKTRLIRLIRQRLYRLLYDSFSETPKLKKIPEKIATIVADITEELQKIKSKTGRPAPIKGAMPPCMKAISDRLADAGHTENFVYAAYLLNKGYTVEQVVDIFRARADFDEKIARYQIEHITGLRGSRIKYRPPSCQRMRELNLCVQNGRLCPPNIRNPLQYRQQPRQTT